MTAPTGAAARRPTADPGQRHRGRLPSPPGDESQKLNSYVGLLSITYPWFVERISADASVTELQVHLAHRTVGMPCPRCGQVAAVLARERVRVWYYRGVQPPHVIVYAALPEVSCPEHGVMAMQPPWDEHRLRMMACDSEWVLDAMPPTGEAIDGPGAPLPHADNRTPTVTATAVPP